MVVATKKGEVKKTVMSEFEAVRRAGLIAMDLEDDDELIAAKLARADDDLLMITAGGQAIRFTVEELRSASRTSGGVRGIRLAEGDSAVSLNIATAGGELLVVTENGYGKRTPIDEYPKHSRGGSGVLTARLTDKTGKITAARVVTEFDSDLMIVSASGVVIRMDLSVIRVLGRTTQGTLVQKMGEGDTVVAVSTTNGKKSDELDVKEEGEAEEVAEDSVAEAGEGVTEVQESVEE
jgi:DNA gyrase subunit A